MPPQTSNPTGSPKIKDTTPSPAPSGAGTPEQVSRFDDLTRKLVKVPKSEVDEKRKDES